MCIASVRDCRALVDTQPVDVTKAKIPWVMRSQAGKRGEREGGGQHGDDAALASICAAHAKQLMSRVPGNAASLRGPRTHGGPGQRLSQAQSH